MVNEAEFAAMKAAKKAAKAAKAESRQAKAEQQQAKAEERQAKAEAKAKAAVEYAVSPRLTLRAEADNLFDARYAQSSYSRVWIYPGQPRNVRLSLRVSS